MIRLRKELHETSALRVTSDALHRLIIACHDLSPELEMEAHTSGHLIWSSTDIAHITQVMNDQQRQTTQVVIRTGPVPGGHSDSLRLWLENPADFTGFTAGLVVSGSDEQTVEQQAQRLLSALAPLKASSIYSFVSRLSPVGLASLVWLAWILLVSLRDFQRNIPFMREPSLALVIGSVLQFLISLTMGLFVLMMLSGWLRRLHRQLFPLTTFAMGAGLRQKQHLLLGRVLYGVAYCVILVSAFLI